MTDALRRKRINSGKVAEDTIAAALTAIGITFHRQAIVGISIYGYVIHADFLLTNIAAYPNGLIVESKWQDDGGTVDEKFPYLLENIRLISRPTVIIAHGGGCRSGALTWLRSQIDGERLIAVLSLEDFMKWAMRIEKRDEHE